jgi:hypothetical protein
MLETEIRSRFVKCGSTDKQVPKPNKYKEFAPKDDVSCIPLVQTKIKDGFRRPDNVGTKGRKVDKGVGHRRKWEVVERRMI